MDLFNRAVFCCVGSLTDLVRQSVPIASYSSPTYLESWVGGSNSGSLELSVIPSFVPPFAIEDSSIQLEPSRFNEITWNIDIANPIYQKGDNLNVIPNRAKSPTGSYNADVAVWFGGDGPSQYIVRPLGLEPQTEYYFSAYLQASGNSRFGGDDEISFLAEGGTLGDVIKLDTLNDYSNRYRIVETSFTTGGDVPTLPELETDSEAITVLTVAASTLGLTGIPDLVENQLVGGRIQKSGGENSYVITANTSSGGTSGEEFSVTIAESAFVSDGYTVDDEVQLLDAPPYPVELRFKVNNTASMAIGGLQLEKGSFRTSAIYQNNEKIGRAATSAYYQPHDNPIGDRYSFTVFVDLPEWRGDGNVLDFGNLKLWVEDGVAKVQASSTTIQDSAPAPEGYLSLAVSVSAEAANISLYVNGRLKARTSLTGFVGNNNEPFVLTSEGFRKINNLTVFGEALSDGQVQVGDIAGGDIATLFRNDFVPAQSVSTSVTSLTLNTVRVPAIPEPEVKQEISNKTSTAITVEDGTKFSVNDPIVIARGDTVISYAVIQSISTNALTLDSTAGVLVGDYAVKGLRDGVSRVFVRFPWVAEVNQEILSVDEAESTVTVTSALSYLQNDIRKSFIYYPNGQEIKEVLIREKDNATGVLTLSDIEGVEAGMLIGQPKPYSETLIHPQNYEATFLVPLEGISIEQKALNGVVIKSTLPASVETTPIITIAL